MSPKESEKIGTVYKDERKRLLGYIRNRISDKVEAEDILQDVSISLPSASGISGGLRI